MWRKRKWSINPGGSLNDLMYVKPQSSSLARALWEFPFVERNCRVVQLLSRLLQYQLYQFPWSRKGNNLSNNNSTSTNKIVVMMTSTISIIYWGIDVIWLYHEYTVHLNMYLFIPFSILHYVPCGYGNPRAFKSFIQNGILVSIWPTCIDSCILNTF